MIISLVGPCSFAVILSPTKKIKRTKKMTEELPPDLKYLNINPRLANFINSLHKNKKGAAAPAEKKQTVSKEDKIRKEKYTVLPEIPISNLPKNAAENPPRKASNLVTDEEQFMNSFDEYKYAAPTLLHDLGKLLQFFSQYEVIFPQGLVNVLNYSWKELIEGAVYTKRNWQPAVYKRTVTGTEECDSKSLGHTATLETADNVKNSKNKMNATMAESGKEKSGHEVSQSRPTGNKCEYSDSAIAIYIQKSRKIIQLIDTYFILFFTL
ncbi:uncharacterized protein O3C94_008669 [Discoglossus pictus]